MSCIALQLEQYNNNNTFLCEPIENTVIANSDYIKLIYSDNNIVMNGIALYFNMKVLSLHKQYVKYNFSFNYKDNKYWIEKIRTIEKDILDKIPNQKVRIYKISDLLNYGKLRIFSEKQDISNNFVLIISGIWENTNSVGLTFKFRNV